MTLIKGGRNGRKKRKRWEPPAFAGPHDSLAACSREVRLHDRAVNKRWREKGRQKRKKKRRAKHHPHRKKGRLVETWRI